MDVTDEPQFLYLTTQGRKTGNPHEIEIWFVGHNGRFYLVSELRHRADWVKNIGANSAVSFRVGSQTFAGQGRWVDASGEPELSAAVCALMDAKYGWSDGLLVELAPEEL